MATLVYELVNPSSHEVFVGLTAREPDRFAALVKAKPPASIAHWPKDALAPVREVETFESQLDAEKFLPGYVAALHRGTPGWKVYCEDLG
jgi:hypothetical protein